MALTLTTFHIALLFIAAAILIAAGLRDAYSYRIPNFLCVLLLLLFPAFVVTAPHAIDWQQHLAVFALVALAGFVMFLGKLIGAGDIKLLASTSLWAGPHWIAVLVTITACVGGLESLIMLGLTYLRHRGDIKKSQLIKVPIPYGIAIAVGGVAIIGLMAQPILLPE